MTGAFVRGAIWWPTIANLVARDLLGWMPAKSGNRDFSRAQHEISPVELAKAPAVSPDL